MPGPGKVSIRGTITDKNCSLALHQIKSPCGWEKTRQALREGGCGKEHCGERSELRLVTKNRRSTNSSSWVQAGVQSPDAGEGSPNPAPAQAPSRCSGVSIQCQVGCSCLEKELLGQVGRKDFPSHTEGSGNLPCGRSTKRWLTGTRLVWTRQSHRSFPTQMILWLSEKERHIPTFALYFPSLKPWDGFWLLSIRYCLASLEVGPTDT